MKRRVAIVGSVGLPPQYGGFETLAHHLAVELGQEFDIDVFCSATGYPRTSRRRHYGQARLRFVWLKANGASSVLYDGISMLLAACSSHVVLVLGVSGCMFLPLLRWLFPSRRFIVHVDGLEWRRPKWGRVARLFLHGSEYIAAKSASLIVCDNASIVKHVRSSYHRKSVFIAYGGDTAATPLFDSEAGPSSELANILYFFTVARVEPENNIETILKGFEDSSLGSKLVIVGNWDSSKYGRRLLRTYGQNIRMVLLGPIYNLAELDRYRNNCFAYLHGHSCGGTNPSLVEAMCRGLPVICHHNTYNRSTTEGKALYFTDAKSLTEVLDNLNEGELQRLGEDMKEVAGRLYLWGSICRQYANEFRA